jgi:hypothetical protein
LRKLGTLLLGCIVALGVMSAPFETPQITTVGNVRPANDDPPWINCFHYHYWTTYAYGEVHAGPWIIKPSVTACTNVSVQTYLSGQIQVRGVICPASGCWATGWGTVYDGNWGTLIWYWQIADDTQYRVETRYVDESIRSHD